jgi:hypothetical protein
VASPRLEWTFTKIFFTFHLQLFLAVLFFSQHHFTTRRGCIAKDASCHVLGLMCLDKNDGDHALGRGCLVKSDDDRVLLSLVPTPSHRVSVGLMTVSERPPAKYLVGPLVVRFLAYFLFLDPRTVSRGGEPASFVDICKTILYIPSPAFFLSTYFLLK